MWYDDFSREFTDPYDKKTNYFLCLDALARYLFCADFIEKNNIKSVLDVGCANGYGCEIYLNKTSCVTGTESVKQLIERAELSKQQKNLQGIEYLFSNADLSDISDKKFDLITCHDTLVHLLQPAIALKNMLAMLNQGGYLIVSVPNSVYEPTLLNGKSASKGHIHMFTPENFEKMVLDIGFKVVDKYGQKLSNQLFDEEFRIIRECDLAEKQIKNFYNRKKEAINYFARLLAYPTLNTESNSKRVILVCQKI